MSKLRLSIVATAVFAAVAFNFAQTGGPPAACPHSSLAGAMTFQLNEDKQKARGTAAATADFSVEGMFAEVCSCMPPCPCEVTEVAMACRGVGAHQISAGNYAGDDLSGAKIAHAKVVGDWVNLYIDAKDEKQRAAAEKFGRAAFAAFGPINEVKSAKIAIWAANDRYTVTVDGGKIMKLETQPVLGGDGNTPIEITNIKNAVNPTVYQGTCVSATYSDGKQKFTVDEGRNSHFNPKLKSSGKI